MVGLVITNATEEPMHRHVHEPVVPAPPEVLLRAIAEVLVRHAEGLR
ncbi:MAG: hypothetical protein QM820_18860 [Minicystis sp.]